MEDYFFIAGLILIITGLFIFIGLSAKRMKQGKQSTAQKYVLVMLIMILISVAIAAPIIWFSINGIDFNKPATDLMGVQATITKDEFNRIEIGMTYEQVRDIIGGDGEVLSEVGKKDDPYHTIVYVWYGEGLLGANANFTFQNGVLVSKAQVGLN